MVLFQHPLLLNNSAHLLDKPLQTKAAISAPCCILKLYSCKPALQVLLSSLLALNLTALNLWIVHASTDSVQIQFNFKFNRTVRRQTH